MFRALIRPSSLNANSSIFAETANVIVQQHSRKFLMMGVLMAETC